MKFIGVVALALAAFCGAALALDDGAAAMARPVTGRRLRDRRAGLLLERRSRVEIARHGRSGSRNGLLASYYHTSEEIRSELTALASRCPGMQLRSVEGTGDNGSKRTVDVVTIRAPGSSPVNRNFLLFGEHSRELISPESGLHLVKTLCGETGLTERAREVLQNSEFMIVVNGNAASRERVEQGDFCLRTNPDGVDLNRNWDEKWEPGAVLSPQDTNPGPKPFSEPETRAFKQLVEAYMPTTFLTIHSGTRGMYMPWAFDTQHLAERNQPQMMEILRSLDEDHCKCPFGAAGREVGYSCPGTCLDWVYDHLKTPYAFAFEIYTSAAESEDLAERWQEKMASTGGALLQERSHLGHKHFRDLFGKHLSSFVQVNATRTHWPGMSVEDCFAQFNPGTQEEYTSVVENWSAAYLDMAAMVAKNLKVASNASFAYF